MRLLFSTLCIVCVLALIVLAPLTVYGQAQGENVNLNDISESLPLNNVKPCDITGSGEDSCPTDVALTCDPAHKSCIEGGAQFPSVKSTSGLAHTPIDVWGACRYVDNITGGEKPAFVPFNTRDEWIAFLTAWQQGGPISNVLNLVHCARPSVPQQPPASAMCHSPVLLQALPELPYARTGTILMGKVVYLCQSDGTGCADNINPVPVWAEEITVSLEALDSDVEDPSWKETFSYSSNPPTACSPGICGASSGLLMSSAPTTGLCKQGLASIVNGTGPWDWMCAGQNGGVDINCVTGNMNPCPGGVAPDLGIGTECANCEGDPYNCVCAHWNDISSGAYSYPDGNLGDLQPNTATIGQFFGDPANHAAPSSCGFTAYYMQCTAGGWQQIPIGRVMRDGEPACEQTGMAVNPAGPS